MVRVRRASLLDGREDPSSQALDKHSRYIIYVGAMQSSQLERSSQNDVGQAAHHSSSYLSDRFALNAHFSFMLKGGVVKSLV